MDTLIRDLKYALRVLRNKPGLTAVALLALALGIGANTALFSILYSVLWKPLPYHNADRLVIVWETDARRDVYQNVTNPANYMDWKEQNQVFEDMAAFITLTANLTGDNRPEEIAIQYATPNIFSVLGVQPALGRNFVGTDGQGEDRIVILSHGLWMRRFGGDPGIVGKEILLSGRKALVVGVMPPGFGWHVKPSMIGKPPELWFAFPITPENRVRQGRWLTTVARLKPEVTLARAQANLDVLNQQLIKQHPDFNTGWGINVVPLRTQFSGDLRKPLWILTGAVVFVLLIACTNVANLMLSRAITRSREMAVRSALGARRSRLVRQLLTECVLMALFGGLAGLAIAIWTTAGLAAVGQRAGIDFESVRLNLPVLSFAFLLSVLTGIVFGIVPSVIASGWNLLEQLKEGSRTSTGHRVGKLRNTLVAGQLAVALLLLSGSALLIQSFWRLSAVSPGFDVEGVLSYRMVIPSIKYPESAQRIQFYRTVLERMKALPGVKSAGMVSFLPFAGPSAGTTFHIEGQPEPPPGQRRVTNVFVVDDGFFTTLKIPLKQGRMFQRAELTERRDVVLINETLAREHFPGENPIGRRITIDMRDENVPSEVIGIVGDVKNIGLDSKANASIYWTHPELTYTAMSLVVRTEGDPLALAPSVVASVREIDPEQPLADIRKLQDWLGDSTARAQFTMALLVMLALVALILAVAGVYGVMSNAVAQRTQEMGIRMALGASAADVFVLVLKEGSQILVFGAALGCAATIVLTRIMKSMLFETSVTDPFAFSAMIAVLIAAGLLACYLPSRRASRVSPVEALRYE